MSWKDLIKENDLTRKLSLDKLRQLIGAIEIISLPKNSHIFTEGDACDGCYFIFAGEIEIYTTSDSGERITLARLSPGQYFGEQACLISPYLRNASARTISKSELGFVKKDIFLQILEKESAITKKISKIGAKQLIQKIKAKNIFFSKLPQEIFNITSKQIVEYHQDDVIFSEGELPDAVYFILQGEIILKSTKKDSTPTVSLDQGNIFGELAVIKNQPRQLTAIANSSSVKLIKFQAETFNHYFQTSKLLQQWLKSLQMVYQIPHHGIISQSLSEVSGFPSITILMSLVDNKKIVVNKLIELDFVTISLKQKSSRIKVIRYENKKKSVLRELSIANNQIVEIRSKGYWGDLSEVCELLFNSKPISSVEEEIFIKRGNLHIYPTPQFYESKDIVCNCMKVSYKQINDLILQRPMDLETVCQITGAGLICGSCRPRIAQMLGRPFWTSARIEKVISHSSKVKSFRFKKLKDTHTAFKPGQHVILQCVIQGKTVERSYTLTNATSQKDYYEVAIKKENQGLFSRWVFNPDNQQHLFKISDPQGNFTIDFDKVSEAIFFAGGIGITPAICFARNLTESSSKTHLLIDYSFEQSQDGIFLDLLQSLQQQDPQRFTFQYRMTNEQGMLQAKQVEEMISQRPNAHVYICGPSGFQKMLHETLQKMGVPAEKIHIEIFVHATQKPTPKEPDYPQDTLGCPLQYRGKLMGLPDVAPKKQFKTPQEEARDFLQNFYADIKFPELFSKRWKSVNQEYKQQQTYWQTTDELIYGARTAWRNSTHCIGRDQWNTLLVRDFRHLNHEDDVFHALLEHIKFATNGGNLQPIISIFSPETPDQPGPRIWNNQLIRYAGYNQNDNTILGDPAECDITAQAERLGWSKSKKSAFDVLPLLIQMPNRRCKYYEIPQEYILEVPISHPTIKEVASLNLKWYAVPMVSNMCLAVGGIRYTAAPFNGWYMGTEIGARNFGDVYRYNMLPKLAEKLGLDTSSKYSLWQDYVITILNVAVLYSFEQAGVKMIDHHTASRNFLRYGYHELKSGHELNAQWSWIVPPIAGSTTGVFHEGYRNIQRLPNYLYQKKPW